MPKFQFIAAAALAAAATMLSAGAQAAMPNTSDGIRSAVDRVAVTEDAQYVWGGRRYCFYPDGWHGAGWYRCGYRLRVGLGWGGPVGWHGWREGRAYRYGARGGREYRGGVSQGRSYSSETTVRGRTAGRAGTTSRTTTTGQGAMGTRQGTMGPRQGTMGPGQGMSTRHGGTTTGAGSNVRGGGNVGAGTRGGGANVRGGASMQRGGAAGGTPGQRPQ
jgi:hypothetical protein